MRRLVCMLLMLLMAVPAWAEEQMLYAPGDAVADFTLTTWDDQEFILSAALAEKDAVVLHFFTLRCGGCEEEMPLIQAMYEQYGDRLAFIAVTIDEADTVKQLKTYCTRRKLMFPVAKDTARLAWQYPIYGVPSTFIIDKDGLRQDVKEGAFRDEAEFAAFVAPYLAPVEATE